MLPSGDPLRLEQITQLLRKRQWSYRSVRSWESDPQTLHSWAARRSHCWKVWCWTSPRSWRRNRGQRGRTRWRRSEEKAQTRRTWRAWWLACGDEWGRNNLQLRWSAKYTVMDTNEYTEHESILLFCFSIMFVTLYQDRYSGHITFFIKFLNFLHFV